MASTPRKKKGAAAPADEAAEAAEVAKAKAAQKKIDDDAQAAAEAAKKAPAKKPVKKAPAKKTADAPLHPLAQYKADAKAAAEKNLSGIATEVNARFESIEKMEGKTDDARLAVALRLSEAKDLCKDAGVTFKSWCEDNITNGYNIANKLALIGASPEPAKALADLRGQSARASSKHRETKKKAAQIAAPSSKPSETPLRRAEEALSALDDKVAVSVARNIAGKAGLTIISETDARELQQLRNAKVEGSDLAAAKKLFDGLGAGDKMKLLEYGAKATGMTLTNPLAAAVDADPLDIPDYLKNPKKK